MCTLAPRAAPVFGATIAGERPSFLKRPRGVAAVAPAACGEMAREASARHVGADEAYSAPAKKRTHSGWDVKIREGLAVGEVLSVVPAPAPLVDRMEAEFDAVLGLLNRAKLVSRGAGRSGAASAGKFLAAGRRLEAPRMEPPDPTKPTRRRTSPPPKRTPEAAAEQSTEPGKQRSAGRQRAAQAHGDQREDSGEATVGGDRAHEGEGPAGGGRDGAGGAARRDDIPAGPGGARPHRVRVRRDPDEEAGTARSRVNSGGGGLHFKRAGTRSPRNPRMMAAKT